MTSYRPVTIALTAICAALALGQRHAQPAGEPSNRIVVPALAVTESGMVALELVAATSEVTGVNIVRTEARMLSSGDIAFEAEFHNAAAGVTPSLEVTVTFYGPGGEEIASASVPSEPVSIAAGATAYAGFRFPNPPAGIVSFAVTVILSFE